MTIYLDAVALILHILGAAVVIGSLFVVSLITAKGGYSGGGTRLIRDILKSIRYALGVQLVTGLYMGINEWSEFGKNHIFWTKIALFLFAGTISERLISSWVGRNGKEITDTKKIKRQAWMLFVLTITIAVLGLMLVESG